MSSGKIKLRVCIIDKNGNEAFIQLPAKDIPNFEDVGQREFRQAFDGYETTMLELGKEVQMEASKFLMGNTSPKK
jgi:hypothetical protein